MNGYIDLGIEIRVKEKNAETYSKEPFVMKLQVI